MMLSGWFRRRISGAEKIDILEIQRKNSIPGQFIPETVVQSQISCVLIRQGDETQSEPTITKNLNYSCYLLEGDAPKVTQVVRRNNKEELTIITEPKRLGRYIIFTCQHMS